MNLDDRGEDMSVVTSVAESLFSDGTTNWGRVASLVAFGASMSQNLKSRGMDHCVRLVADEISSYLLTHQREWLVKNQSWVRCYRIDICVSGPPNPPPPQPPPMYNWACCVTPFAVATTTTTRRLCAVQGLGLEPDLSTNLRFCFPFFLFYPGWLRRVFSSTRPWDDSKKCTHGRCRIRWYWGHHCPPNKVNLGLELCQVFFSNKRWE